MFVFRKIWRGLFSCNTRFEICPFASLPANFHVASCSINTIAFKHCKNLEESQILACKMSHDRSPDHLKTSLLFCRANQWTGFYMIVTFVMKELNVISLTTIFSLSSFTLLVSFYTPWKYLKTRVLLMFSGGIERKSSMKWVNTRSFGRNRSTFTTPFFWVFLYLLSSNQKWKQFADAVSW